MSFPEALQQKCTVHFYRNVNCECAQDKGRKVASILKATHAQEDREASLRKARLVIEKVNSMKLKAASTVEDGAA